MSTETTITLATKKQVALFKSAYADANMAAEDLQLVSFREKTTRKEMNEIRRKLGKAVSALTALDELLAGNPEPKRGDK